MFVGIGNAYRSTNQGSPKFIELLATKDIDDLENYRIYNYQDGSTSSIYSGQFDGSIKKGEKILIYHDYWSFYDFFSNTHPNTSSGYAKVYDFGAMLYYGMRGGNDVFEIVYSEEDGNGGFNNNTDVVDVLGVREKTELVKIGNITEDGLRKLINFHQRHLSWVTG